MNIQTFNSLPETEAKDQLLTFCGSDTWATEILQGRPYADVQEFIQKNEQVWYELTKESDWLQAFTHHPQIGNLASLKEKYAGSASVAANEQAAVDNAHQDILQELAALNERYLEKHGFIFIVFATGKSALEMTTILRHRLLNSRSDELQIAMGEQYKILLNRLKKAFPHADWKWMQAGQLTTHILDTSSGNPAANMYVKLKKQDGDSWLAVTEGLSNADGRIPDFIPQQRNLPPGNYQLQFDTGEYFISNNSKGFYPEVLIHFEITDTSHYHVPLLISPYGYSTYRGS